MIHPSRGRSLRTTGVALSFVLLAACGISLMPTNDPWYTQHYSIMQDFERTAYRTLSEAGKKEFQSLFWAAREPASKAAFEERLGYIMTAFKRENSRQPWNTDRARIYMLNGPPASIEIDQNTNWGAQLSPYTKEAADRSREDVQANRAEVWTYSFHKQHIQYAFVFSAPNGWKMVPAAVSGSAFIGELEDYSKTVTFGIRDPERYKNDLAALEKKK